MSASWDVPAAAVSGVYIAKLSRTDGVFGESHIIFVVRDDESHSDIIMQTSDETWVAYSDYGGSSLYGNNFLPLGRAYEVSYNRPLTTRDRAPGSFFFGAEYAMVRFMEENGYDVSYSTGVDTDRRGSELLEHKIFVSAGHDEYWSGQQRANVEAARDAGVNLAFFSGNEVFWKTRWGDSIDASATPYTTLISYKETHDNAKTDPLTNVWTGTWRDPRFSPPADGGKPENALTGTSFAVNGDGSIGTSITVGAADGQMRFSRNTSVANLTGSQTKTVGQYVLGYEWDEDVDNGFRPNGLFQLSTTTVQVSSLIQDYGSTYAPGTATHHMTLYRAASGALVFGAGTIQYSWGLDSYHDGPDTSPDPILQQATVNLFADMGVQPGNLMHGLVAAVMSTDYAAPISAITAPTDGATLTANVAYTIRGTAQDLGGGRVAGVEVSVDGGATWHPATGRESWTYTWTPRSSGQATILSRATDDSGNIEATKPGVTINPSQGTGVYSLWSTSTTPATVDSGDAQGVELGMRFRVDTSGYITGIKFYKAAANTGTHVAHLWSDTGVLLATATFTSETGSGWQQVDFATPVPVSAGASYVASYTAPKGHYSVSRSYFASLGVDNGPLHAVAQGPGGSNGVFVYSPGSFPTQSYQASNYWVDVVLNVAIAADVTAPTVTKLDQAGGAAIVTTTSAFTVTFSEAMNASSVNMNTVVLVKPDNKLIPGSCCPTPGGWCSGCPLLNAVNNTVISTSVSYDAASHTATVTPTSPLDPSTVYTMIVNAGGVKDLAGNALAVDTWGSFYTSNQPAPVQSSLWTSATTPSIVDSKDGSAVELGLKFTADVDGTISGARFYKSSANTGTHTASLWTASGQLLATATFSNETASGWQQVTFSNPVSITAGTTYVISYHTNSGHYSVTRSSLTSQFDNGVLHALANGGVYAYGANSAFPTQSYQSSNYFVDVVFTNTPAGDTVAPTITNFTPFDGTGNVPVSPTVTVHFSEALDTSTVSASTIKLLDGNNNAAPATVTYDAASRTATLTPTSPLAYAMNYTIFVLGGSAGIRDLAGNPMAINLTSAFTTVAAPAPDTTAPTISTFSPANGANSVSINPTLAITFSEPINAATVMPTTIYLLKGSATQVATTLSYNAATNTVTLAPTAPLLNNTSYTIFVRGGTSGIKDLADNALAQNATCVFTTVAAPTDTTPPTVTAFSPSAGATNVAVNGTAIVTFSEALSASSVTTSTVYLRDAGGNVVAASVSYNSSNNTVTVTPSVALANSTAYTIVVKGGSAGVKDAAGNALAADATNSFTTAAAPSGGGIDPQNSTPTSSLWSNSPTPSVVDSKDGSSVELGVKFTADTDGTITGLRFYKSAKNTGTHTGSLWTASGQLLATATFTGESASGWQTVTFSSPVAITAGTTYVASYHTTSGHYSVDRSYFNSAFTSGHLAVPANGGVYAYGSGGFPSSTYQGSNYWVDVVLNTTPVVDTTAPTVTAFNPSAGATNVSVNGAATVTFSETLTASSVTASTVYLRDAGGNVIASSVSYNASNKTVTLTPSATLANSTTYTIVVKGGSAGVKDAAGNALAADATSSFTTAAAPPVDTTPPTVTAFSPSTGATNVAVNGTAIVTFSETLSASSVTTSTVYLRDAGGNVVAASVSYNSSNNTVTVTPSVALANSTAYTIVVKGGSAGVKDAAGNALAADATSSFTTAAVVTPPTTSSLWSNSPTPSVVDSKDGSSVELGVKFTADTDGTITGLRFYKSAKNTGTHTGSLWTASGQLLATATFTGESASGWQTVTFSSPVAITAGTTYVASYHTTSGHYSVDRSYFNSAFTSGHLAVPANGGVYAYGSGGFPSSTYQGSNYWVDVVLNTTPVVDTTAPTVTAFNPSAGATNVSVNGAATVTFSETLTASSVTASTVYLRNAGGNVIASSVSYNASNKTVTLTPSATLANSTTYTIVVKGGSAGVKDAAGNALAADATSSFTTAAVVTPPPVDTTTSLWSNSPTPSIVDSKDGSAVELGVQFTADVDGYITGLRFYKSAANTGTHTASLWTASGQLLATATFTNETASGWQTVMFSSPVAITAGTTYVASYHTNAGRYSVDRSYFNSQYTSGHLMVPANGGVYSYGSGGFPSSTYQGSNYWIDPLFVPLGT